MNAELTFLTKTFSEPCGVAKGMTPTVGLEGCRGDELKRLWCHTWKMGDRARRKEARRCVTFSSRLGVEKARPPCWDEVKPCWMSMSRRAVSRAVAVAVVGIARWDLMWMSGKIL